jgi:hypothetical protein
MAKKGKWADITPTLPRLATPRDEAVERAKFDFQYALGSPTNASAVANIYASIRLEKDAVMSVLAEVQIRLDAIEQILVDQYEAEGTTFLRLDDGVSVGVNFEPVAQVEDPEAFRLWCLANGYEKRMTLHPSTTQSVVKERLLEGEPEPDGVTSYARPKITLRK